jgi:hypothetical protein
VLWFVHTWLAGFHHHFWGLIRSLRDLTQKCKGTTWVLARLLVAIFKPRNVKICTQEGPQFNLRRWSLPGFELRSNQRNPWFLPWYQCSAGSPKAINCTPILGGKVMTPTLIS